MNDDVVKFLGEMIISVAETNAATMDMLSLICLHLAEEQTDSVLRLRETMKNLRDQNKFETTAVFVALADRLFLSLSQNLDAPILSLKRQSQDPLTAEELRSRLYLIQGGKP